jgi:hypothetical protein
VVEIDEVKGTLVHNIVAAVETGAGWPIMYPNNSVAALGFPKDDKSDRAVLCSSILSQIDMNPCQLVPQGKNSADLWTPAVSYLFN